MKLFVKILLLGTINISIASPAISEPQPVRFVNNSHNENDPQKNYFVELLKLALSTSDNRYQLQPVDLPMTEQRQLKSLQSGELDVMWSMTTIDREQQALPIRIPLLKGLLGYRIFVIRKDEQYRFSAIAQKGGLKELKAIQGMGWPDVDIMQYNGFQVETTSWYQTIYKMLSAGHFDYFPRSVLEASSELDFYHFDNLAIETRHLFYYPTAIYYFVANNNHSLANALETGLREAIKDGRFDRLLFHLPQHERALKTAKMQRRIVHSLKNPLLPEKTPTDQSLWYGIE